MLYSPLIAGKFAEGFGNTGCTFCDDTNVLKGSTTNSTGTTSSSRCQCNAGEYADESTRTCKEALEGVSKNIVGMTTTNLTLEEGFWRTMLSSLQIETCLSEIHCVGGSDPSTFCADGYEGPICAVCSSGYAQMGAGQSLTCRKCTGGVSLGVTIGLSLILIFILGSLRIAWKWSSGSKVRMGVSWTFLKKSKNSWNFSNHNPQCRVAWSLTF